MLHSQYLNIECIALLSKSRCYYAGLKQVHLCQVESARLN